MALSNGKYNIATMVVVDENGFVVISCFSFQFLFFLF